MLRFIRIAQLQLILCCLLTLCLAKDDENYDNSTNFRPRNVTGLGDFYQWVGSYYNATAEVELKPVFGDVWNESFFGPDYTDNLCSKLRNSTQTVKYDAILSIIEKGEWNAGSNSLVFWLTLIPKSLAGFNVSSLGADFMDKSDGLQFPLYSVHPSPNGFWRPMDGKGPDLFNFTTRQTNSGAYNLSAMTEHNMSKSYSSYLNLTMPVCNTTELSGDYRVNVEDFQSWQAEGWDDFRYPSMSIQFDDKTANMTMDAVFAARPYLLSNVSDWKMPTTDSPGARGFMQIRVSGAIDAYHSDSLSLEDERPVWLRTVGFGNDSSNIGYDSGAIMLSSGSTLAMIAIAISIAIML